LEQGEYVVVPFIFYKFFGMAIYKVRKRNGTIVTFDRVKIEKAIKKAIQSVGGEDFSPVVAMVDTVIDIVGKKTDKEIPEVELIQDVVEEVLIKEGHDATAKSYILYREKRNQSRKDKRVMIDVADTMEEYLSNADRRIKENANIGYSIGGLILKNSEKITANYWLSRIYPEEVGNAHRNADFHIHDLGFFTGYCAGRSLRMLLEEGFNGVPEKVESFPPKNLQSAVNQMVNFLGVLQNEWAGAQAFSSVDTYLAPYVHKYRQEEIARLEKTNATFDSEEEKEKYIDKRVYKYTLQNIQNLIFGLNTPSRW
jgi:ribonucleoside-triphosphate reductase